MRNFQGKKSSMSGIFHSWPALLFLTVLLLFFALGVIRFVVKMRDTAKNKKIAEMKVEELRIAREKLGADIENLKTEKGIEENIREKFGLAKEGEGLIVVVDDKNNLSDQSTADDGWFMRFLKNWFK